MNKYGEKCRFKDQEQVEFTEKRYNKARSKAVIFRNKEYSCVLDMAEDIGIKPCTAYKWIWRGFNSDGEPCRYKDDDRELVFEDRHAIRNKARTKSVVVNGIKYESCKVASESLGIPNTTLYNYLQGRYNNPKYVCSYYQQS